MFLDTNLNWQSLILGIGLHVVSAIAVLFAGRWLAGVLQRWVVVLLKRTPVTPALAKIITRAVYYGTLLMAIFTALVILGVQANILIGGLGLLVVIAAVALRESLRDLAAMVNFIIFQPFKVGDIIQTNGITGKVQEMLLLDTVLVTADQIQMFIPNGNIQNNTLVNLSASPASRLNLSVRLSYADEVQATKDALLEIARADERVLETPAPVVHVMSLGESQVEYMLRVFARPTDFIELQPALNERIKRFMEQRRLALPLPQLQVHDLRLEDPRPLNQPAQGVSNN